jgi:hypothetical protein
MRKKIPTIERIIITPMKLISLQGSHYDIGNAHGDALAEEIRSFFHLFQAKLAARNISLDNALKISRKFEGFVEKHTPELQ